MRTLEQVPEFVHTLPEVEIPVPGARGWMIEGCGRQVVFLEFEETVDVPEHTHAEQWEFPLAGKVILHRGKNSTMYLPGENFYIPAGERHGATVHAGYKAMIIFNEKGRYEPKK